MKFNFFKFIMIGMAFISSSAIAEDRYRGEGHMMITPDKLNWSQIASMGEGAEIAYIEGDISNNEPFTFRLRLDDGYEIRPHIHPAYERVTVLEGTLYFAHGKTFNKDAVQRLPTGSVAIMPTGEAMYGYSEGQTIIQLHGTGPWGIEYIDPKDDPRTFD